MPKTSACRPSLANLRVLLLVLLAGALANPASGKDSGSSVPPETRTPQRNFRAFLPKPGETIDDPASQLVQILLDRQDQGGYESYMVQVLFHGKPAPRNLVILEDRMIIDFYDTGKPSTRLAKIRGGVLEASAMEDLFYKDTPLPAGASGSQAGGVVKPGSSSNPHVKRMVRLTLFIHVKVSDLKFRDTLDRTLIHFRVPKSAPPTIDMGHR